MIKQLTLEKSALQYMKEQTVSFEEMMLALSGQLKQLRSEERRVGKESRSRWSPDH